MLDVEEIVRAVLREHGDDPQLLPNFTYYLQWVTANLSNASKVPTYSKHSSPLSVVSFRCLLQDTGYPAEVYSSSDQPILASSETEWGRLRKRWVGWGVQIPGEQAWSNAIRDREPLSRAMQNLAMEPLQYNSHPGLQKKYPLAAMGDTYTGALIKVYDDVSFRPASTYTVLGILSTSAIPQFADDLDEYCIVPAIHVLLPPSIAYPPSMTGYLPQNISSESQTRSDLVAHLATAFSPPDILAAEFLLLSLLSSVTARPTLQPPIGTMAVNFIRPASSASNLAFTSVISSVSPLVVELPLSLSLLHTATFSPVSKDSTNLDAGLLQLAAGTVLIVQEDEMREGGQLDEKAVKNLNALIQCAAKQIVRYEYPYMEDLTLDCNIRVAVLSKAKSFLPVDVHIPLLQAENHQVSKHTADESLLEAFRAYLTERSSPRHAAKFVIPDTVANRIQDDFVRDRQAAAYSNASGGKGDATNITRSEERLKRQMRIARLLALSYPEARLTTSIWERTVDLDNEVQSRIQWRDGERLSSTATLGNAGQS